MLCHHQGGLEGSQQSLSHREPRIARVPLPAGSRKGGDPDGNGVPVMDPPLHEAPAPTWLLGLGCEAAPDEHPGVWRMCQVMEVPCGKGRACLGLLGGIWRILDLEDLNVPGDGGALWEGQRG